MTETETTQPDPIALRIAALEAASRIHQRVGVPNISHKSTAEDRFVLRSAVAFETYLRTGEYDA